jgi:RHS repeat-associated protein
VWSFPASGGSFLEQVTQYYPSGLPWWEGRMAETQNRKYNGKEFVEAHGYDTYDYGARGYYPAIMRFTTVDPLAEKYYSVSPYAYCAGNPVLFIDPDGKSTHLNRLGYIVQEEDDGDDGVYTHNDLSNWDNKSKLHKSGDGISNIGNIGETLNIDEIYSNLLELNISEAKSIWNPFTFRNKVKTDGEWDLKHNKKTIYGKGNDGKTKFLFQKKEIESQDVGNHHFGVVAKAYNLFSEETILKQAGAYQIKSGTSRPEWQTYSEVTITSPTTGGSTVIRSLQPPYGDDPRDQMWIKSGFNYYKIRKR